MKLDYLCVACTLLYTIPCVYDTSHKSCTLQLRAYVCIRNHIAGQRTQQQHVTPARHCGEKNTVQYREVPQNLFYIRSIFSEQ